MNYQANWSYEKISDERQLHLRSCPEYMGIVEEIVEKIKPNNVKFKIERGRNDPVRGGFRPVFVLTICVELFDWFFNSECGYRAQYYCSQENGLAANQRLLTKARGYLLQAAETQNFQYHDPQDGLLSLDQRTLRMSLQLQSAKAWGDECEGELYDLNSTILGYDPYILAPRWMENAKLNVDRALKGVQAPRISRMKFIGAFIKDGSETVPFDKLDRSEHIYYYGYS